MNIEREAIEQANLRRKALNIEREAIEREALNPLKPLPFVNLKNLLFPIIFLSQISFAQDIGYARSLIDTLAAPGMHGRGYVNYGDKIAAGFLANEFEKIGLSSFSTGFQQHYSFPMNTLPGKLAASANGKSLVAGSDFQVWSASPSIKGTFKVHVLTSEILSHNRKLQKFISRNHSNEFILIDKKGITDKKALAFIDSLKYYNFLHAKGLLFVSDTKLVWSVMIGSAVRDYTVVDIKRESIPKKLKTFAVEIESEFIPNHKASNVIGWVKGHAQPDTFLVFTAHYDHLGRMGSEVYYPGANDNASGTAMVADLARHYSLPENKPYYSMVFILLSGEEAGLFGSKYCASHPPFNLKNVKFLINIDMVGTGSEGITLVNATKYKDAFERMKKINTDNEYILTVKERGESCNSDHCPFYQIGVPAVFVYSMGKEFAEYHNPDDRSSKLPLSEYNDIFRLLRNFMDGFAK
ncbi:MAG: M28 family metallopeptidase [Bacteroidales bacterium]